jgi:WD40 repeat protein
MRGILDQTLKLWDVATGQLLRTFVGHTGFIESVESRPTARARSRGV